MVSITIDPSLLTHRTWPSNPRRRQESRLAVTLSAVKLTTNELAIIPSAVAAIAIIGGYFGVRSANSNALNLAREERQARRTYELTELKREVYFRCLEVLNELEIATLLASINAGTSPSGHASAGLLERKTKAYVAALNASGQLKLFGPPKVIALMNDVMVIASRATPTSFTDPSQASPFNVAQAQLIGAMVASLEGREITKEVLDAAVSVATAGLTTQAEPNQPDSPAD